MKKKKKMLICFKKITLDIDSRTWRDFDTILSISISEKRFETLEKKNFLTIISTILMPVPGKQQYHALFNFHLLFFEEKEFSHFLLSLSSFSFFLPDCFFLSFFLSSKWQRKKTENCHLVTHTQKRVSFFSLVVICFREERKRWKRLNNVTHSSKREEERGQHLKYQEHGGRERERERVELDKN